MATSIVKSTIWSSIQRFGGLAISFVSNMVLARLLSPDDFGVIGLIMVFVTIADVLVDGGLGNALIQKKEITNTDKKTVFTANFVFSIFLFVLVYSIAPFVESYTGVSFFATLLRVQAICILIRAFYVINLSQLNRDLNFSNLAWIALIAQTISTIVAIVLAYLGYGVWSLIIKTIAHDLLCCILYAIVSPFRFKFDFDKSSFIALFKFGFPVALANIIESVYSNGVSFIIGKHYSVKDLGYYNQAAALKQIPVYSVSAVINQVFFPYFARLQDDENALRTNFRNTILVVTFFVFPLLSFLLFFAEPVITILYSSKWIPCVPIFQVLCFSGFFNALYHLSRSTIKAIGKSRLLLITQIVSIIIAMSVILLFLQFNITVFVWAIALEAIISYSIVGQCIGKYLDYSIWKQYKDIAFSFAIAFLSAFISYRLSMFIHLPILLNVLIMLVLTEILFSSSHFMFRTSASAMLIKVVNSKRKNNGNL